MKKLILLVITIVTLSFTAFAQIQYTTNTLKLDEGKTGEKATIQDMKRLGGTWLGEGLGGTVEEIYSEAQDGVMMGSFRFLDKGKTVFYEFILVKEENDTLAVRLKHFSDDFSGWEEKDKNVLFKFVKKDKDRMYFEGQTFEFIGKKMLNIYVAIKQKDGSVKEEVFRYKRKK
ncbi:MAG: DUF6265 family protein [Pyrinomonadaceae bacterium]|jgi:hypothetical protein|nr:DUF6265 family protein [Pyrinomonadaceae bacterium]